MPVDDHPLYDTADCSAGQSGKVWFLGGTYTPIPVEGGSKGDVERDCTVPTGTALFFPVINSEAATLEGDGEGDVELRAKAKYYQDHARDLYATVDGVFVNNLENYRVQSPLSQYGPLPVNSITCDSFATPDTDCTDPYSDPFDTESSDFVGDGVYLMLPPLPVGKHTITFGGQAVYSIAGGDPFDFTFTLDAVYYITVVPGRKK